MRNIYILDEYSSSTQNGIGTFLRELLTCFENENVCLIEFNSTEKVFCIKSENKIKEMHFPVFQRNGFLANYKIIDKFFRLYIEDSSDNLFMFNHSPCEKLMQLLKESFPLSKMTFTIHDFGWTAPLLGDFNRLKDIVLKEKQKRIQNKYKGIINYFHEEQRMYEIADKVICLSEDSYHFLQEIYLVQKDKICLLTNGLKDTYILFPKNKKRILKQKMFLPPEEKIILFAGRATHAKGVPNLLESFKQVLKKYPECRLVLIGTVYDPSYVLKLSKSIAAKVSYTGLISREELSKWYQISDIGVIASLSEQCSYTGIEMMMHGLPVIASDGFGVRAMFQNDVNAKVTEIGNRKKPKEFANNLANTLLELLSSEKLCEHLGQEARKTYETRYTPEKMRTGYDELLKQLYNQ
jgi:glycosyltransferase